MNEQQIFANAEQDIEFLNQNFKKFEMQYPNKFIAISGARVVATGETPDAVFEAVEEKKLDRSKVIVEFIPIAGSILVL